MMKRLVGLLALLVSVNAPAREIEDRVAALAVEIDQITAVSQELEVKVAPGRGFITEDQAIQRFQDHVYLHMIGEYELAAEGFFALVTTAALSDSGLHRDAEWYLAETLFQMGNYVTAEARFQGIAEDENHPFRDDGVRRLLELYAATNQTRSFYHYYERDIVRGRVKPSDLITYTIAKSFYQQGDLVQAKSHLLEMGEDSSYFRKARYFLGAILVREGDLEAAAEYFLEVAELSVNTLDDRKLLDLSLLALGRIYYELGDFGQASEFYSRISGDSEYLADKLYEIVWSFIKQSEIDTELVNLAKARDADARDEVTDALNHTQQAIRGVEIFLLAFPEHEYTAQLKLLEGHLHMQVARYDGAISTYEKTSSVYDAALSAYEKVIIDYTPIQEYFGQLADSDDEGREYFKAVLTSGGTGAHSKLDAMPAYA
ncbi:MAG: tetratricopeptide repeat protein, partial [Proteobacteria bacterium]|nr:tetratricopeptide repeat protein [Pseudomonadota bacterium]